MPKRLFLMGMVFLMGCGLLAAQYETSPEWVKVIPEAIWAPSGGGTWFTEVQVEGRNDGTELKYAFFMYGGGSFRTVTIGANLDIYDTWKTSNILGTLDYYDSGTFTYYGRVGAVSFQTQDSNHRILVNARTWYSTGYSKSFNAISNHDGQVVKTGNWMEILNVQNNSSYRCALALLNFSSSSITVRVYIINSGGAGLASKEYTLSGYDFKAVNPFSDMSLTGIYNDNHILIYPVSGNGRVMAQAAIVHNDTADPSARPAVNFYW